MKKRVLAGMVAAATMGLFTPLTSHAFGLGKIDVMSALNEPFRAEIGLTALRPEEKDNLQVKMASEAEFTKAGLNRSMLLNQMQFDIIESAGRSKILITSKQPIKEPFLDFLISATAGSGILIREYTVLLDPPEYVTAASRGTTQAVTIEATTSSEQSSTTRYQYAQSSGFDGSSYSVKRSDTLWNVALKTRPGSDITVHQMMMALLKANPDAFTNQNVNGLKAGVTLQIPSRNEITAMSSSAARAAFAEQNEAWNNRNRQTAAAVTTTTQTEATEPEETLAATEIESESEQTATEATESPSSETSTETAGTESNDGRLQLVAPDDADTSEDDASPNVAGNEDIKQLTEQLTLAQETIEAQTQENIDFKERMDAMEEQLETMRRLISLKDADLARLQSLLEEEDPELAAQAEAVIESDEAAEQAADLNSSEAATLTADTAPAIDSTVEVNAENPALIEAGADQGDADKDVISSTAEALNLDADEVKSTIDQVKQFINDNKLPAALGLLLVLLLLWLLARRSGREVTWDEAVKKMDKDSGKQLSSPTVVAPVANDTITDAPLSEQEHEQEKSVAELVEQADMFVGYADYVQARSSLEQARSIEPDNTLVAYKMLFVLYKQHQTDEFIELAEEVPFEADSYEWSEIKQWGRELAPAHSLFAEKKTEPQAIEDSTTIEAVTDVESDTDNEYVESEAEPAQAESDHLEFNLNDFADSEPEAEPEKETTSDKKPAEELDDDLLSFDTNYSFDEKVEPAAADDADIEPLELDITEQDERDDTLSFAEDNEPLTIETESMEEAAEEADFSSTGEDEPDLEFDIGDLDEIDEAETKLDLAAAYVDMGDPEGARSILNEVLVEGNDEQKNRAQDLLNSLS